MDYKDVIKNTIKNVLSDEELTDDRRKIWPKYCYHFTPIENALKILQSGKIMSRNADVQVRENANTDIIKGTKDFVGDKARLYFRPRTPMLYRTEGFRPNDRYKYVPKGQSEPTKTPFPVYFLFNLDRVLNQTGVLFSENSLALHKKADLKSGLEDFSNLPFKKIYYSFTDKKLRQMVKNDENGESEIKDYKNHNHAELIINELSLSFLYKIVVRSEAERDTLIQYIKYDPSISDLYVEKILVDKNNISFFKYWDYINNVRLNSKGLKIELHTNINSKSDFVFQYTTYDTNDNGQLIAKNRFIKKFSTKELKEKFKTHRISKKYDKNNIVDGTYFKNSEMTNIILPITDGSKYYQLKVLIDNDIAYNGNNYQL